jgi:hypothetical protein
MKQRIHTARKFDQIVIDIVGGLNEGREVAA